MHETVFQVPTGVEFIEDAYDEIIKAAKLGLIKI